MTNAPVPMSVRLERFNHNNADMVLSWRNATHVRANSLNDAEISREHHLAFVRGLADRPERNFYVLYLDDQPEAVFNVNVDDTDDTNAQWGCYIGPAGTPRPGLFPLMIGLAGSLAFGPLQCSVLYSEVVDSNKTPQKLNAFLGVPSYDTRREIRPSGEAVDVVLYQVDYTDWQRIRNKIDNILTSAQRNALACFESDPYAHIT